MLPPLAAISRGQARVHAANATFTRRDVARTGQVPGEGFWGKDIRLLCFDTCVISEHTSVDVVKMW